MTHSNLNLLPTTIWAIIFPHNPLPPNPNIYLSPFLSAYLHPNKRRGPNSHCNTHSDHGPHTSGEVRSKVCAIEDNAPPSVNRIAPGIHTSYDHGTQAVFFVAKYVVGPGEEGRLAGVYGARPVVHAEMDRCVLRVGEDKGGCYNAGYAYPVSDCMAVRRNAEGRGGLELTKISFAA